MSQKSNNKKFVICLKPKASQIFFFNCIQNKEKVLPKKSFLRKNWRRWLNKKRKEGF